MNDYIKKLESMTSSELVNEQLNMALRSIVMAFIEGFKVSTKTFNWENVKQYLDSGEKDQNWFTGLMIDRFKEVCGINE